MFYLNPKSMRNVCGLDVHKDNVFVCIDKENGEKIQFKTGILTKELDVLRDTLVVNDVTEIAMESTSVYWMPIWRVLENDFKLYLVNPYAIKQLPGRKSDIKDAEWIATCLRKELIRGSYVPNSEIQQLRQYNRRIFDINKQSVYIQNKIDAALQRWYNANTTSILTQRIDEVSLEMKEQQSEDVAISVSDEKKDAKDMEQSASSDYSEQTEAEEEKVARSAFRR